MDCIQNAILGVTAAILLTSAIFSWKQNRSAKATAIAQRQAVKIQMETAELQKHLFVYSLLQDETMRNDRETIFKTRGKPAIQYSDDEVRAAERICQKYNFAVMMVDNGLLESKILEEKFGEPIRRLGPIMKLFIMLGREKRGDSGLWKELWNFIDKLEKPSN